MANLTLRSLELHVNLGWHDKELLQKQVVLLDAAIWFAKPPQACFTDDLNDTICYATLTQHIHTALATQKFRLLERLGYEIYQIIKSHLTNAEKVNVRVTKYPDIEGLRNGVTFDYRDHPASW